MIDVRVLLGCFVIAAVLGGVMQKTHFCTMGAVSDWINIGDKGRLGAWFFAIAVAMAGTLILESASIVDFSTTRPPYRSANFAWSRYLLGGLMFGAGMSLAGGCGTKNLLRLGGGSLKSLLVVIIIGGCAYLMTRTNFYAVVFHGWTQVLSIDLEHFDLAYQDLGSIFARLAGASSSADMRLAIGGLLITVLCFVVMRSRDFRDNANHVFGASIVGLSITGGWFLTGGPWGLEWIEAAAWMDEPPAGVGVQSFTFVNPMGESLVYLSQPGNIALLTFGVVAIIGVILGALVQTTASGQFRIEWFVSWSDFGRHVAGAALMGIGGVLAMGCTVGQGLSGVSTLALGSFLALGAIIFGSATTMKIQYYKMLYEDASVLDALLSGWADLHLLPQSWRRLTAL